MVKVMAMIRRINSKKWVITVRTGRDVGVQNGICWYEESLLKMKAGTPSLVEVQQGSKLWMDWTEMNGMKADGKPRAKIIYIYASTANKEMIELFSVQAHILSCYTAGPDPLSLNFQLLFQLPFLYNIVRKSAERWKSTDVESSASLIC